MPLAPGARLGPYEVTAVIAQGGMGEVYQARDERLRRWVALKVLRPDKTTGVDRQRLLREARAASALNHPHIITVHDIGSEDEIDYIAMELVEGESLATILSRGRLDATRAAHYALQVADALSCAHKAGIIHRDLKPANLMIGRDGRLKVLDFGIAKLADDARREVVQSATTTSQLTARGALIGTLAYMSPEQAKGLPVDARSDIFSFGAVLYELLAGCASFRRRSSIDTLSAIVNEQPTALHEVQPDVPGELVRIVDRCLRKDPGRRFQSMADLHATLQDFIDGLRTPKADVRAGTPWWVVIVGVMLLVVGAAAVRLWFGPRGRPAFGMAVSRLTFEPGLQTQPVWSPDGEFLAYSAEQAGNFDIYVQQVSGGDPVRVTRSLATDWQPDWSPNGNRLVFRSERDRGGLFVVPVLGGREERISSFGYRPRWSPDGERVMFVSSAMPVSEVPEVYVVETDAKEKPRRILTTVLEGFKSVWSVQWHPTRDVLTFLGRKDERGWDFWVAFSDAAAPAKFEIPEATKAQIVAVASAVWAPDGRAVYIEGTSPSAVTNLYRVEASVGDLSRFPTPQMLTSGLQDSELAISKDGRKIAYTRRLERNRIWRLPLEPNAADTHELGRPLTDENIHALLSDATADGARLAFVAFRDGQSRQELWDMSLVSGEARARLVDDFRRVALRWSRDSRRLVYRRSSYDATRTRGQHSMVLLDSQDPDEKQLTSPVEDSFDIPYDWSSDGLWILGGNNRPTGHSRIAKYLLAAAPRAETSLETIAECTDCDLWQARYSPDDTLIAFTRVPRPGFGESVIHLVRATGGPWVPITDRGRWADKPRWAPRESTLYYISNRVTGAFNVWSQRINPTEGRPVGEPVAVTRFSGPGTMINPLLASVELSVVPGAIVLPVMELSGNIWLLTRTSE